jgi:hypothetical protein
MKQKIANCRAERAGMRDAPDRIMRILILSLAFLAPAVASVARAEPPPPVGPTIAAPQPPVVVSQRAWYGWQTLLVDGAATGLLVASIPIQSNDANVPLFVGGLGTFALGAPIAHVAHDHPWRGLGSLGLRLGLPAIGLAVGAMVAPTVAGDHPNDTTGAGAVSEMIAGGLVGAGIGAVAAMAIDASVLAWDSGPAAPRDSSRAQSFARIAPNVGVTPRGASVGLAGTF